MIAAAAAPPSVRVFGCPSVRLSVNSLSPSPPSAARPSLSLRSNAVLCPSVHLRACDCTCLPLSMTVPPCRSRPPPLPLGPSAAASSSCASCRAPIAHPNAAASSSCASCRAPIAHPNPRPAAPAHPAAPFPWPRRLEGRSAIAAQRNEMIIRTPLTSVIAAAALPLRRSACPSVCLAACRPPLPHRRPSAPVRVRPCPAAPMPLYARLSSVCLPVCVCLCLCLPLSVTVPPCSAAARPAARCARRPSRSRPPPLSPSTSTSSAR